MTQSGPQNRLSKTSKAAGGLFYTEIFFIEHVCTERNCELCGREPCFWLCVFKRDMATSLSLSLRYPHEVPKSPQAWNMCVMVTTNVQPLFGSSDLNQRTLTASVKKDPPYNEPSQTSAIADVQQKLALMSLLLALCVLPSVVFPSQPLITPIITTLRHWQVQCEKRPPATLAHYQGNFLGEKQQPGPTFGEGPMWATYLRCCGLCILASRVPITPMPQPKIGTKTHGPPYKDPGLPIGELSACVVTGCRI